MKLVTSTLAESPAKLCSSGSGLALRPLPAEPGGVTRAGGGPRPGVGNFAQIRGLGCRAWEFR